MSSTYTSLHYHIVFSTKDRQLLIDSAWSGRLHEYLGGTVNKLDGFSQGVGGMPDHVHLLVGLKSTHCLADFMRELKKAASSWIHEENGLRKFAWQVGYGAFTVSPTLRGGVRRYIANQEEHHRKNHTETNSSNCSNEREWNTIRSIWIDCLSACWHPSGMRAVSVTLTGDVASLNHRLMAGLPPGSLSIETFTSLKMPLNVRIIEQHQSPDSKRDSEYKTRTAARDAGDDCPRHGQWVTPQFLQIVSPDNDKYMHRH